MIYKKVKSSNILKIGYDEKTETMEVQFKSGTYQYYGVPAHIYKVVSNSRSVGSSLASMIYDKYPSEKLTP